MLPHNIRGFSQPRRGLILSFCSNDFRTPLALGFCLFGHGTLHFLRQVQVFNFDGVDLDPPLIRFRVQDRLQAMIDTVTLGQEFVQLKLPQHIAQHCLRFLIRCRVPIFDIDNRFLGAEDVEEHDRVHLQRDVVFGNDVLGRHIDRDDPGIHLVHAFDARDDKGQPRPAYRLKLSADARPPPVPIRARA